MTLAFAPCVFLAGAGRPLVAVDGLETAEALDQLAKGVACVCRIEACMTLAEVERLVDREGPPELRRFLPAPGEATQVQFNDLGITVWLTHGREVPDGQRMDGGWVIDIQFDPPLLEAIRAERICGGIE